MSVRRRVSAASRGSASALLHEHSAVAAFRRALLRWFDASQRDLPWRRTRDPYRIWLSEVLLQQTRVEAVRGYYERFIEAFPSVAALATSPLDEVLRLWAGLGYYRRARNLHAAAREIVNLHNGRLPASAANLDTLPGVGRYTAAAVASIAFGEAVAALDGNIKRVLARLFAIDAPIDEPATAVRLWGLADKLLAPRRAGDFNQAMMELGATVCAPKAPRCLTCPVRNWCHAAATGMAEALPRKTAKRPVPRFWASAASVWRAGKMLVVQRPARGLLGGLWELPSAECANEAATAATVELAANLNRDYGVRVARMLPRGEVEHQFTHRLQRTCVFTCDYASGRVRLARHVCSRWIGRSEVDELAWSTMDRKILAVAGVDR